LEPKPIGTFVDLGSFAEGWEQNTEENKMARDEHNQAAEHHENAAKAHRSAAEHHDKADHAKGMEQSARQRSHLSSNIETHGEA
jgi:hypothetical protein